jgi:hypothetical protein
MIGKGITIAGPGDCGSLGFEMLYKWALVILE